MKNKMLCVAAIVFLISISSAYGQEKAADKNENSEIKVKKLVSGFKFTEGPAADKHGNIYFTDIPNSKIYKWSVDGKLSTFIEDSKKSNGLYFDKKGNMIACAGGAGKLFSIDTKGKISVLADSYKGKRFNSPNDLWIDPKGGIYFTDPRYSMFGPLKNLPQNGECVYYLSADRKKITRIIDDLVKPNGIIGTDNGKTLYVADQKGKKVYSYSIKSAGNVTDKKLFADQNCDGMTLDENGNVYLTSEGVNIYSSSGKLIRSIKVQGWTSNVCFGGKEKKTLFITAGKSLYSIDLKDIQLPK